jgi:serine phosphatase RsbU (regulator of sigma subunit)
VASAIGKANLFAARANQHDDMTVLILRVGEQP